MKRKTFLLAVIAMAVNGLDKSFGATKKPTPKPKVTAKVTPIPKATLKTSPSPTPSPQELPVLVDGAALKLDSLTAPTSIYAVVIKANREYPLLIAKPTDRTIKIFTARCPHQGTILNLSSHGEFRCELHGARFDETTGKVLDGPTINNLDQYSPIIKDGRLYISI